MFGFYRKSQFSVETGDSQKESEKPGKDVKRLNEEVIFD